MFIWDQEFIQNQQNFLLKIVALIKMALFEICQCIQKKNSLLEILDGGNLQELSPSKESRFVVLEILYVILFSEMSIGLVLLRLRVTR